MVRTPRSRAVAFVPALAFALVACGGTGSPTAPVGPVESDDVPIVTAAPTAAGDVTAPPGGNGGSTDNGNGWPVTVNATIGGQDYFETGGSYNAAGAARVCGNFLASMDPTSHAFTFEFPLDGEHNPRDVAFAADDLASGSSTSTFSISVSVKTAAGAEPPAVVARPGETAGDAGQASLTDAGGIRTLTVDATNDFGTTINLTAVCGPAPG